MIDIKIMGCKERKENIERIVDKLFLQQSDVCYDEDRNPLHTAIKAWNQEFTSDITHRVLLQDDIELCKDFIDICNRIVKTHPDKVIALFPFDTINIDFEINETPFYDLKILSGAGIICPTIYIESFVKYANEFPYKDKDNWTLYYFCKKNNIRMIQTVPALIQHIGDFSLYENLYDETRRTPVFSGQKEVDWENKKINTPKYYDIIDKKVDEKIKWSKQYIKNLTKERSQNNNR